MRYAFRVIEKLVADITDELLELFNLNESKDADPQSPKAEDTSTTEPKETTTPYEDGVLNSRTLDQVMNRTSPVPEVHGVDMGFHLVKNNTSFSDLF